MSPALPSRTARTAARATTRTAVVALTLALGLSGCGAGLRAQTYQERTTSDSTNEAIGALAIRHIRVLPPQGRESYPVGADARVGLVIVNEGEQADRLTSVTSDSAATVEVQGPGGRPATLSVPGQSGGVSQYTFLLKGLTRELRPGQYVQMELTFAVNGAETMLVPVEVTGTPGPRREGYHPAETDSNGDPIVEEEEENAEEGADDRPELDNDGGDPAAGDGAPDVVDNPAGDENGGTSNEEAVPNEGG